MPITSSLPKHLRRRREKVFGEGRPRPLDREAKVRIMARARALSRRTEKGKHYGALTAKALAVLEVLLWGFHNSKSGLCFPGYETIAERAGCARSTVAEAIKALEEAGVLSWVNRLKRVKERCEDLFGRWGWQVTVQRTSNAYHFTDPRPGFVGGDVGKSSKSEFPTGTPIQDSLSLSPPPAPPQLDPLNPLHKALLGLRAALERNTERPTGAN